jgi:hypothetical protein
VPPVEALIAARSEPPHEHAAIPRSWNGSHLGNRSRDASAGAKQGVDGRRVVEVGALRAGAAC